MIVAETKPRIYKGTCRLWACQLGGVAFVGKTPKIAYERWKAAQDLAAWMRSLAGMIP